MKMNLNSEVDQFDRIPDPLVLDIFNKLADVRSLGRCSSVSKRFNALVPLVHDVYVKIEADDDPLNLSDHSNNKPRNLFSHLLKLAVLALLKPLNQLRCSSFSAAAAAANSNKPLLPQVNHHSPAQVLKNFPHIRNLRVELPAGDVGTEDGVVLKWRAEFGSSLRSCVILGGTKVDHNNKKNKLPPAPAPDSSADNGSIPDSFYTNGGLKLRVVWTISSLIAASTRHHLLRPIIEEHPTIRSLVLTDADGQGTLSMGEEQLREFRENPVVAASAAASNRTQVPASNMKLRYAPFLELPEGVGMQGATLVAIRPSEDNNNINIGSKKEVESFVSSAFDGPLNAAVKALAKRRTYLLEMNGF